MSERDDVARFSSLLRAKDAAERSERAAEMARADAARALTAAQDAKASAVARLKSVRATRSTPDQIAAAEADYRMALAALVELEQGQRPSWAPALPVSDESGVGLVEQALQGAEIEGMPAHQDEVGDTGGEVGIGVGVGPDES